MTVTVPDLPCEHMTQHGFPNNNNNPENVYNPTDIALEKDFTYWASQVRSLRFKNLSHWFFYIYYGIFCEHYMAIQVWSLKLNVSLKFTICNFELLKLESLTGYCIKLYYYNYLVMNMMLCELFQVQLSFHGWCFLL